MILKHDPLLKSQSLVSLLGEAITKWKRHRLLVRHAKQVLKGVNKLPKENIIEFICALVLSEGVDECDTFVFMWDYHSDPLVSLYVEREGKLAPSTINTPNVCCELRDFFYILAEISGQVVVTNRSDGFIAGKGNIRTMVHGKQIELCFEVKGPYERDDQGFSTAVFDLIKQLEEEASTANTNEIDPSVLSHYLSPDMRIECCFSLRISLLRF